MQLPMHRQALHVDVDKPSSFTARRYNRRARHEFDPFSDDVSVMEDYDAYSRKDTNMQPNTEDNVEVVDYIELTPNIPGMFRFIAHMYATDPQNARNIYFGGWPNKTEEDFQKVITGKYIVSEDGESVRFID